MIAGSGEQGAGSRERGALGCEKGTVNSDLRAEPDRAMN